MLELDPTPERLARFVTYYVVPLFSRSFHEAAHAWTPPRPGHCRLAG